MLEGLNGVHHVALSVPDLEAARKFYVEILGLQEVWRAEWDERHSVGNAVSGSVIDEILGIRGSAAKQLMVRAGNIFLEFFEFSAPEQLPQDPHRPVNTYGYTHIAFDVRDVESVYRKLCEAGMRFHTSPKKGDRMSATYGRDPFGNVIEIQEVQPGCAVPPL